jgi:hypothetical protein
VYIVLSRQADERGRPAPLKSSLRPSVVSVPMYRDMPRRGVVLARELLGAEGVGPLASGPPRLDARIEAGVASSWRVEVHLGSCP